MEQQDLSVLRAQLSVVGYLQRNLPLHPTAWIIKNIRTGFIFVFIHERSKYIVAQVIAWYLFFTCLFPYFVSYSLLPYDCGLKEYSVKSVNSQMPHQFQARVEGCDLQKALRDWRNITVIGPVLFLSALALSLLLGMSFTYSRRLQRRILWFAKPFLPRLFYNGLGPAKSDHSAWHLMQKHGLGHRWSFWHDSLGSLDLVLASIALVLTIFFGFVAIGYMFDRSKWGFAGATAGAAAGAAVARVMLLVLNYALGASSRLVSCVDEQLHGFQPYKKVLGPTGIKKAEVWQEVRKAAEMVRSQGKKAMERTGWDGQGVEALAQRIDEGGFDVIHHVVNWLGEHKESLFSVQNVCFYLFNTGNAFSSDAYGIASLSMMDIPLLLATYYDPTWKVLGNFVHYNKEKWTPFFKLTTVYIGYPRQFLCKMTKDGSWKIARLDSEQALHEMEDLDQRDIESSYKLSSYSPPHLPERGDTVAETNVAF